MRIIVQKFGGSSVATVEKLQAVAEKIVATRRAGFAVVVVVSAMGNTTDDLLATARELSDDPPRRELDMLLSVGERISMALLSIAIQSLGEQAISFTGSQVGIVTTDSHNNARIIDVRPFRVQDELERGRIVIVAGYQGTSYKREITTLGRGGSDTTAVALAAALGAESCDIYSDVAGVYSADPRVVDDARPLDEISYAEMQEMARHGARVLNPQAVEFARRKQIALYARSTFGGDQHTAIRRVDGALDGSIAELARYGVRGVAGAKDRMLVSWEGMTTGEYRADVVFESLDGCDLVASASYPQQDRVDVLLSTENVPDADAFAGSLRREFPDMLTVRTGLGSATVVGLGVGDRPEAVRYAQTALNDAGIAVNMVVTARESLTFVVRAAQVDAAVQALHAAFFDRVPDPSITDG